MKAWSRCSRACWIKKITLLVGVNVVGTTIMVCGFHLHDIRWGILMGVVSGLSTIFIPYEAKPDVRLHDKDLKIHHIDMNGKS